MSLPVLFTAVVLFMTLDCSLTWGKPPVKPQQGNTVVPPSAEQASDETISGFLPGASEMEANLASTFCSGLWTHSTFESCFPPSLQPCSDSRPGKQLTQAGKLQGHSQQKPQSDGKDISRSLLSGFGNMRAFNQGLDCCQQGPGKLDEEPVQDGEPPLTLAECSRLVSAYIKHPEWQDFLDSGRHATTQTTAVKKGWNGLKLDTVSPADKEMPFPDLTQAALKNLMQLSPTISRLNQQLRTGNDPLADRDALKAFINKADPASGELFAGGNHSLVIKWRNGPGYVLKIARSERDNIRLGREQSLYLWLRNPDNILLNLTTTPMRAAFSVSGKPILALRQVDGTARDRLLLMREHHSLNERLDFALSVIFHFCQMYRRFLEKDVLLADRHDDNIGFNEIPLQGRKGMGLDDAIMQVPVMLDLDPYWFGVQEFRTMQLWLPTWVPVVIGLLEEVFTPVNSDSQTSKRQLARIDQIRKFASPVLSSSVLQGAEEENIEAVLQSCIDHWFHNTSPEYSQLLAEARSHIEPLLARLNQWDSAPRTVAEWNKRLQENIGEVLQWLDNWRNETEFSLLKDFADKGIIRVPSLQGANSPQDQQALTLLSMIHGKLGCQKCSRTFTLSTEFRRHWQLHQQKKLQHCALCGGDFLKITDHERVHTGEKNYKCELCGKYFSRKANLQAHLRTHSGEKPYQCEHCGRCYSQNSTLRVHLRTHSGDRPYKCRLCSKYFFNNNTLQNHLRTHSGERPYKCELCGKTFSRNFILQNHLHTHSSAKPYTCEHCGKGFSQNGNLQSHLRTHSGDKPHKCGHCDKSFSRIDNMKVHLSTHSGDKPHKCEHCNKCFSQSSHLQNHLRTHSGDKPYKCRYCGKSFAQTATLTKHQRTHTGEKPYKCEQCGKCFSQKGHLTRHLHTHTTANPQKSESSGLPH